MSSSRYVCSEKKKIQIYICALQKGETREHGRVSCESAEAPQRLHHSIVDPLVFSPFSYRTHSWAKSRNMHIKSKLKSSPEMYARQRHLSFFFTSNKPFRRWQGNFQAKEMIIWASYSRLQMNIHISAWYSVVNFTNNFLHKHGMYICLATQKW